MGFLDKILGKKKPAEAARNTSVAKGLDAQDDAARAAGRAKMEAEMEASRAGREATKPKDE